TQPNEDFRVVQMTPRGSRCSIALLHNAGLGPDLRTAPGSLKGLHLVVTDIEAAAAELAGRGVSVSGLFHFADGRQQDGPDPKRGDYESFFTFNDPDDNVWMVQERKTDPWDQPAPSQA
ncbi:MAG: hypothetical protein ACRDSS_08700, partial [Actinocrinis sp.]